MADMGAPAAFCNDAAGFDDYDSAMSFGWDVACLVELLTGASGTYRDGDGLLDLFVGAESTYGSIDQIVWYPNGDQVGTFGPERVAVTSGDNVKRILSADVDMDGDLDFILGSSSENRIAWYPNVDDVGTFGTEQVVSTLSDVSSIWAGDLDRDGDVDLAAISAGLGLIVWFENVDGAGNFGPQVVVDAESAQATSVTAADIDGDGNLDLVSGSTSLHQSKLAWYKNTDGAGSFGPSQLVSREGVDSTTASDIDGDGDVDLVLVYGAAMRFVWFENTLGNGSLWVDHVISTLGLRSDVLAVGLDMDGDGDVDLAAIRTQDNAVVWFDNVHGNGSVWEQRVVSGTLMARALAASDVDGDGDIDLASVALDDGRVVWLENKAGDGSVWEELVISPFVAFASSSMIVADMDGDGDKDVAVGATGTNGGIVWFSQISRGPFHSYLPSTTVFHDDGGTYGAETGKSFAFLVRSIGSLSRCSRDTLILPPGRYECAKDTPLRLNFPVRIQSATFSGSSNGGGDPVVFDCEGGGCFLLFNRATRAWVTLSLWVSRFEIPGWHPRRA